VPFGVTSRELCFGHGGEAVDRVWYVHLVQLRKKSKIEIKVVMVELPAKVTRPNVCGSPDLAWANVDVVDVEEVPKLLGLRHHGGQP
jgi:hypothetical protein